MKETKHFEMKMPNNTTNSGDIKRLEKLLIENLGLIGKLKLIGKLSYNITQKHISFPLNKALQKSWKIATWGNRSSHDYAKTIRYKTVNFATAAPISVLTFGIMMEKVGRDCSLFELCPPLDVISSYPNPITTIFNLSISTTAAYLAVQAFNRTTGDSVAFCGQTTRDIISDTLSAAIKSPINVECQKQLNTPHVQR